MSLLDEQRLCTISAPRVTSPTFALPRPAVRRPIGAHGPIRACSNPRPTRTRLLSQLLAVRHHLFGKPLNLLVELSHGIRREHESAAVIYADRLQFGDLFNDDIRRPHQIGNDSKRTRDSTSSTKRKFIEFGRTYFDGCCSDSRRYYEFLDDEFF